MNPNQHNPYAKTNIPLSPEESYLASRLVGRSLFSAMQLSREAQEAEARKNQEDDVLRIPIPMSHMHKTSEDESPGIIGRALQFNRSPIRSIMGGDAGFKEARRDYYDTMRQQIQKELQHAQREYLTTLGQIKQSSETPLVDLFCNGMATEVAIPEIVEKRAGNTAEDVNIEDNSIKRLLGDALGVARKPIQPALDLGATGLLGTGAGAAYITYMLKKKMRERDNDSFMTPKLPTHVELVPYK